MIYDHDDYKTFLRAWIQGQANNGRGQLTKMAAHLKVSSTLLSHILNDDKHFSLEMVHDLADYLGLGEDEFDYFMLLVLRGRAGSARLRERLDARVRKARAEANRVTHRMKADQQLSEHAKATFYSHWLYSGIRNLTACPGFGSVESISTHLQLPRAQVALAVDFLLEHGLCQSEDGRLKPGVKQTHVDARSPLVGLHHRNWRLHGLTKVTATDDRALFFTAPMSLSVATAEDLRRRILEFISEVRERVRPSPSEQVQCLNIDWFTF